MSDVWRNYLTFKLNPEYGGDFFVRSKIWWLSDCVLEHSESSPLTFNRIPGSDMETFVTIVFPRQGLHNVIVDGDLGHEKETAIHVYRHSDQTIRHVDSCAELLMLYVPCDRLGWATDFRLQPRTFPISLPVGALLRSMLLSLREAVEDCSPEDGIALADAACAFLEPILRDPADMNADPVERARKGAILRYIDERLADPGLDAARLCEVFEISRTSLYRFFNEFGGVNAYISGRRMRQILGDLSRSSHQRGIVRKVAEKYGYDDITKFNRTFRRKMGMAPSDALGTAIFDGRDATHMEPTQITAVEPALRLSRAVYLRDEQ